MATIHVDDDADDNDEEPYQKIQTAIDNADTGDTGDTIDVAAGTYDESVKINVKKLTLEGPNAGHAGDSDQRGAEATVKQGIEVNASNVTLDGLDVTNSDVNGIVITEAPSNVTVANTVVRDIAGGTAGPSKGVGNGINLQFNDVFEQTSTDIEVTNNLITGVATPDASGNSPDADAIGVQLLPRGNDVVDLQIANNTIEDIQPGAAPGGRSEARAVSIATQFTDTSGGTRGDFGQATNLTVAHNDVSNLTADFARAVNLFEDKGGDTTTNDALGPVNFTITKNSIDGVDSIGQFFDLALFIGEYNDFGDDHSVQNNDFHAAGIENFGDSDALDVSGNTFSGDTDVYYLSVSADLDTVFSENTFEPEVVVGNTAITRPPTSGEVLNVDQVASFNSIEKAVDRASAGNTIAVGSGTFDESVTIDIESLTLEGPNAGIAGDSDERGDEATIEQTVVIDSVSGIKIDGLEVTENNTSLTSGVSIQPGSNGIDSITLTNSIISGMSDAGGGGTGNFTFGILSFGGELSGVTVSDNFIKGIGTEDESQGVAVSLEKLTGSDAGDGVVVKDNTIDNIRTLSPDRVGTGIALRPNFDPSSSGRDSAADVTDNSFSNLGIAVTHPEGDTVDVDLTDRATVVVDDLNGNRQRIFTLAIQDAVDAADDGNGDTVEVGSGKFDESVTIDVEDLTLEGPNAGTPGDHSGRSTEATLHGTVNIVGVSDVTIDGFEIAETSGSKLVSGISIEPSDDDDITVKNNIISGISKAGGGGSGDFSFGILSFGGSVSGVDIKANKISNVGRQGTSQGLAVSLEQLDPGNDPSAGDGAVIEDNTIKNIDTKTADRPGTGIALRPNFNGSDSATNVKGSNSFENLDIAVSHPKDDTVAVDLDDVADVVVDVDTNNEQRIFTLAIQDAVTAAENGDTIDVAAGTYNEDVTITTDDLTLSGAGSASSIINGEVFVPSEDDSAVSDSISGLTMKNFKVDSGNAGGQSLDIETGGGDAAPQKDLKFSNNEFVAPNSGFAVFSGNIEDTMFEDNTFRVHNSDTAEKLVFVGGKRSYGSNRSSDNVNFTDNTFTGDVSDITGGAVALEHEAANSTIDGNNFGGDGNNFDGVNLTDESDLIVATFVDSTTVEDNSGLDFEGGSKAGNDIQNVLDKSPAGDTVEIKEGGSSPDNKETYTIDQNPSDESNKNTVEVNASDVIIEGESDGDELQVPDNGPGIEITGGSTGVEIKDVGIESNGSDDTGIVVGGSDGADNCTIKGNSITVNPDAAVKIKNGSTNSVIEDNSLETAGGASGGAGVLIKDAGGGNLIALNDIDSEFANGVDIQSDAGNVTVRFNNLRGNNAGIKNNDDENVNARSNFWGDKTGPSGGVNDPETGRTADGEGSSINNGSNDGKVRYDEFLEIPNGFILDTGSPPDGRDTDDDDLHEDFNDDSDHFPTDGYLFLRALRQGHFDRLADIDNPGGDLSTDYTTRFDFDGDGSDDISRSDVVSMVINRNRD